MLNRIATARRAALLLGALESLLAARLVLKLFAARPDNPIFAALFAVTRPFATLLGFLDAPQPRFGAILEYSTLAWMVLFGLAIVVLRLVGARRHRATPAVQRASHL